MSVLLPEPLLPTMATAAPVGMVKLISVSAGKAVFFLPYTFPTFCSSIKISASVIPVSTSYGNTIGRAYVNKNLAYTLACGPYG